MQITSAKSLITVTLLAIVAVTVSGQSRLGMVFGGAANDLVTQCKNITVLDPGGVGDIAELGMCIGYLSGVIDGATSASKDDPRIFSVCVPEGVSRGQVARIIIKYAADHPETLHWPASRLVIEALSSAFPCSAK